VPRPLWTMFDYRVPDGVAAPAPGSRVRVPFGAQTLIGLVIEPSAAPPDDVELKALSEVLDPTPALQADVLELIRWAAAYYRHPIGEAVFAAVPAGLRKRAQLRPLEAPRYWQARGETIMPTRAPKQAALWQRLRDAGEPIAEAVLRTEGFETRLLRALERKGAIEHVEAHEPTSRRSFAPFV